MGRIKDKELRMRVLPEQQDFVYEAVEAAGAEDFSEWARPIIFKAAEAVLKRKAPGASRKRRATASSA
jgi:hypothetical protein